MGNRDYLHCAMFDLVPCQMSCQSLDTTEICAWRHSFPVWQSTLAGIFSLDILKSYSSLNRD